MEDVTVSGDMIEDFLWLKLEVMVTDDSYESHKLEHWAITL